ncbi:hypothetical protein BJX68DRAFT_242524 [Aspergillus pseudodeflectus]|uniref:C2H2-type domain-containing protein n=1 Tax=Aspergillus pseudodeflectus TaxID=176178 RepID=A0ABR4JXW0_9EURO
MSIRHQKRPANRASVPLPRAVSHAASSPGAEYALHPTMPGQPGTRDTVPPMPQSDTVETDTSPMSDDAIHESVQDILDTLKSRGKDNHVCPWGNRCTKGGVGPDGNVVVFERNSAFRAHLEKHERLYRCDLPRCKNRKGFARRDQLERHQKTVPHDLE